MSVNNSSKSLLYNHFGGFALSNLGVVNSVPRSCRRCRLQALSLTYTCAQVVTGHVRKILRHPTLTQTSPTHSTCLLIRTQEKGGKLQKLSVSRLLKSIQKGKITTKLPEKPLFQNLRLSKLSTLYYALVLSRN